MVSLYRLQSLMLGPPPPSPGDGLVLGVDAVDMPPGWQYAASPHREQVQLAAGWLWAIGILDSGDTDLGRKVDERWSLSSPCARWSH